MTDTHFDNTPIRLEGLLAGYSGKAVLHDLDLVVESGERVVLLGPNGAGKTTLFRCILGLVKPLSGRVRLFDRDPSDAAVRRELLGRVGTSLESPGLPAHTRPIEYLEHFARLCGLTDPRSRARQALRLWDLPEQVDGQHLSLGQRQRLQVARSLLHAPRLAMLDEPAANLDPSAQEAFWELLDQWQKATGSTLVVSTHHLEEAYRHGPRWILLGNGRFLADGAPQKILSEVAGSRSLRLSQPCEGARLGEVLSRLDVSFQIVGDRHRTDNQWRLVAQNTPPEQSRILSALVTAGLGVVSYGEDGTTFEESYRLLLGEAPTQDPIPAKAPIQMLTFSVQMSHLAAAWAAARLHGAGLSRERRILLPLGLLTLVLTGSVFWALPTVLPSRDFYLPLCGLAALLSTGLAGGLASDLVAGERERRSLETFLCAPASPAALVFGRALSILIPALGFSWIAMALVWGALSSRDMEPSGFSTLVVALAFAPGALLLSLSIGIWVSCYSRTVRAAAQLSALITVPLIALTQAIPFFTPYGWSASSAWAAAGGLLGLFSLPVFWRLTRKLRPERLLP